MADQLRSADAVRRAIAECDRLGREQFLSDYGFRESKRYMLRFEGHDYDSKAIVGVAYGYEHPERGPLASGDFSGGIAGAGAAAQLTRLGLEIVDTDSPPPAARKPLRSSEQASPPPPPPPPPPTAASPGVLRPSQGDLSRTLFVLPCSGEKASLGQPSLSGPRVVEHLNSALATELEAARDRVALIAGEDRRRLAPARERYSGALYRCAGSAVVAAQAAGAHVLIVSGGYGVVLADEPIGTYDRRFKPGDWPRKLAGRVLAEYAARHSIRRVVAFLARTTSYANTVRSAPWPASVEQVELVSADHRGGGAMRIVPETLGEAFTAALSDRLTRDWRSSRGVGVTIEDLLSRAAPALDPPLVTAAIDTLRNGTRIPASAIEQDVSQHEFPGLYAWYGDDTARSMIEATLGGVVDPLLYVGQAGATKWPSGSPSSATLGSRIRSQHIGGNNGSSTLRRTLAAALSPALGLQRERRGLDHPSEERLRSFMREHLAVAVFPIEERDQIAATEEAVVKHLDPPLNLDHVSMTDTRQRLKRLRSRSRGELE
jgi:hypothetical protein